MDEMNAAPLDTEAAAASDTARLARLAEEPLPDKAELRQYARYVFLGMGFKKFKKKAKSLPCNTYIKERLSDDELAEALHEGPLWLLGFLITEIILNLRIFIGHPLSDRLLDGKGVRVLLGWLLLFFLWFLLFAVIEFTLQMTLHAQTKANHLTRRLAECNRRCAALVELRGTPSGWNPVGNDPSR